MQLNNHCFDVRSGARCGASQRGGALVPAVIGVVVLAGISSAVLAVGLSTTREMGTETTSTRAFYAAEAGISRAMTTLTYHVRQSTTPPTGIGSMEDPRTMRGSEYWTTMTPEAGGRFFVVSTGRAGTETRTLEAVLTPMGGGVFSNAIFAGNSSADPNYELELGGEADQADDVRGDVFSGRDVRIEGDATVTGVIRASGTIYGGIGETDVTQPLPDLAGMNYEINNDFNVAALFVGEEYYGDAEAGGFAWQVPEENPAHIFRKNPSDRESEWSVTDKDDYFLEDPYEEMRTDPDSDGSDPFEVTVTGAAGKPGPDGKNAVYFIDGNLWVHNLDSFSFKLAHDSDEDVRVTFVVKGNIVFSDNIFYEDADKDGIAFVAIEDAEVENSGNIYFGDPEYGTLEYMAAYMFAENNFYDNNLDADGSKRVHVNGTMSAGNQVAIERDFGDQHSKLSAYLDERLMEGSLELPGIPWAESGASGYQIASWREIAYQD